MRISDWSSDVCSSDLLLILIQMRLQAARFQAIEIGQPGWNVLLHLRFGRTVNFSAITGGKNGGLFDRRTKGGAQAIESGLEDRSEEHTSELQSLMRISYAVFCLQKKKQHITTP